MRIMTPSVASALTGVTSIAGIFLIQFDLRDNQYLRLTTASYNVLWGGNEYTAAGGLLNFSKIEEDRELGINNITISLSATFSNLAFMLDRNKYYNRPARIWMAVLDNNNEVLDDPILIFRGRIDTAELLVGAESIISASLESFAAGWRRCRKIYYTDTEQKQNYPDDTGLRFTKEIVSKELVWGAEKV